MGDQLELVSKEYVEEFFFSEDEFSHTQRGAVGGESEGREAGWLDATECAARTGRRRHSRVGSGV